jgi:hypothetical protein
MTSKTEQTTILFAGLPRRHGLAAAPVLMLCLALASAFAFEVIPLQSPQDRFYELEAQRDFYVRAAAARQRTMLVAAPATEAPMVLAQRARPAVQARTPALGVTHVGTGGRALAAPVGCDQAR